jgi:hypothetical protein
MGTGVADSWYHEEESAWAYGDLSRRALFFKLRTAVFGASLS